MRRIPITTDEIATLAKTARLDLPTERHELLVETMTGIFELLDSLDGVELGETAPAMAFNAKWEDQ
jgi:Asp-tRNA(Asn)/Glu-tRNA(Gln) amidotransferase C subunit